MSEYIKGMDVANAIADDDELYIAFSLGELEPYYMGTKLTADNSCIECRNALDNGMPDASRCETCNLWSDENDPENNIYRRGGCGYIAVGYAFEDNEEAHKPTVISRLKNLAYKKDEFEIFMHVKVLIPVISAETLEETINLLNTHDLSDDIWALHLCRANQYRGWGLKKHEIAALVLGSGSNMEQRKKWLQRVLNPLIEKHST